MGIVAPDLNPVDAGVWRCVRIILGNLLNNALEVDILEKYFSDVKTL